MHCLMVPAEKQPHTRIETPFSSSRTWGASINDLDEVLMKYTTLAVSSGSLPGLVWVPAPVGVPWRIWAERVCVPMVRIWRDVSPSGSQLVLGGLH